MFISDKPIRFLNLLGHFGLTEEVMDQCLADETEAKSRMTAFLAPLPEQIAKASATDDLLIQHAWTSIERLALNARTLNCLKGSGIEYIWQLVEEREEGLYRIWGFGPDAYRQVRMALAPLGLKAQMPTAHLQNRIKAAKPANIP